MAEPTDTSRLFTVIMDFEGTTSAAQFRTSSVQDALRLWLDALSHPNSYGLTDTQRTRLIDGQSAFDEDREPVLLDGLRGVWCSTISPNDEGLALLNIIETVDL